MKDKLRKEQGVSLNDSVAVSVSDAFNTLNVTSPIRESDHGNEVVNFPLDDVAELLGEERLEEMLESVQDDTVEVKKKHLRALRQAAQTKSIPFIREAFRETGDL